MAHRICALLVREPFDEAAARAWGVTGLPLAGGLRLVHLSHHDTERWQERRGGTALLDVPAHFPPTFPREAVVLALAAELTGGASTFALVMTDYFGGVGDQWACVLTDGRPVAGVDDINAALRLLGVRASGGRDEFDTVGLGAHRRSPDESD